MLLCHRTQNYNREALRGRLKLGEIPRFRSVAKRWALLKYRPSYPSRPFASLEAARAWVERFVRWYNEEHRHSAINYITPRERHEGQHIEVLAQRKRVYEAARARHPERWSGATRNCDPIDVVCLNPERAANQVTKKSA